MKQKFNLAAIMLIIVAIVMFVLAPVVATAGDAVMDRATVTLPATSGAGTWTQNVETANIELKRISIVGSLQAGDTVTVSRVTGNTKAETNTVTWLALSSGAGSSNLVHAAGGGNIPVYMKRGDKLTFSSALSTGATAYVEYLIQSR
jgi:hypothetical protein